MNFPYNKIFVAQKLREWQNFKDCTLFAAVGMCFPVSRFHHLLFNHNSSHIHLVCLFTILYFLCKGEFLFALSLELVNPIDESQHCKNKTIGVDTIEINLVQPSSRMSQLFTNQT